MSAVVTDLAVRAEVRKPAPTTKPADTADMTAEAAAKKAEAAKAAEEVEKLFNGAKTDLDALKGANASWQNTR